MIVTRRRFLAIAGAALQPGPAPASGVRPLKLGDDRDGFVYTPPSYRPGTPTPLVLMLHGANGGASLSEERRALVDELGCVWLAPDSRDPRTWDLLLGGFGPDVDFIADALQRVYAGWSIDRRRLAIAGTSDGASYALSLGLGIGDVFGSILAFAPGVMQPSRTRGKPRVFIAHGTRDPVMPIDTTSRNFVARLRKLAYDVTYREYDGGHAVPPAVVRTGFEWFVGTRQ